MPRTGLTHPEGKTVHARGGTTDVQSVLLPKGEYRTPSEAKDWLARHGYRTDVEDSSRYGFGGKFWRARQFDPPKNARMRIIHFGDSGIEAVVAATGPLPARIVRDDEELRAVVRKNRAELRRALDETEEQDKREQLEASLDASSWVDEDPGPGDDLARDDEPDPEDEPGQGENDEDEAVATVARPGDPFLQKTSAERFYDAHPKAIFGTVMVLGAISGLKLNERLGRTVTPLELQPSTAAGLGLVTLSIATKKLGYPRTSQVAMAAGLGHGLASVSFLVPKGSLMSGGGGLPKG